MKAKNALVGIGMLAMVFGVVSGAQAITLQEYMNAPDKVEDASKGNPSKGQIVAHVYSRYLDHYKKTDTSMAECMAKAYFTKTDDGHSRLNGVVKYNLEKTARSPDAGKFTVEGVIESVIKGECGTATSTPQKSGRSN
jgi:hypothetical protein